MQNSTSSSFIKHSFASNNCASSPVILRNIRFSYNNGKTWTLNDLNLSISSGERVAIIGRNGSGKSTLAKIIAGLAAPDSGYVQLCGKKVFNKTTAYADEYRNARKFIGVLFQNPEDQIITTVAEDDIAFGLENLQIERQKMRNLIDYALKAVHMENQRYKDPSNMSGGQMQRIALAGSIAMQSKLLVLDEPTSMLDAYAHKDVDALFDDLHKKGTTIVQITHRFDECKKADRILLLENGILRKVNLESLEKYCSDFQSDGNNRDNNLKISQKNVSFEKNNTLPEIEISHLSVKYEKNEQPIIEDYSLNVNSGEIVAIMGKNGSGKSTLAKTICGLLKASSGNIKVNGIPVTGKTKRCERKKLRQTIGYVMQLPEQQLFAQTVRDDIAYGPQNFGLKDDALKERVDETLHLLHLENLAEKSPFALSGGQQRLVAIAGVLACKPRVLVLDEPTAGLDIETASLIRKILNKLNKDGVTIVLITHNFKEAESLGARIITLDSKEYRSVEKSQNHKFVKQESCQNCASYEKHCVKTKSLLNSFDPRVTLLSCFMLMLSAFSITKYLPLVILAAATFAFAFLARVRVTKLLASLHMIFAVFIFSGLLNILAVRSGKILAQVGSISITTDGVHSSILFATRFSLVIIIGAILVISLSQTLLTEACSSLFSPLKYVGIPTQEIALVMSLALRFLPTISKEAHCVAQAQFARGGSIKDGSIRQRLHAISSLIVPGFAGVIRHSETLSLALDSRCYVAGVERTRWHFWKIKLKDIILLIVAFSIIGVIGTCAIFNIG